MANRYPLVVNTTIPRIEELKGTDDLDLSLSLINASNGLPNSVDDVIRYNGGNLEWISANNFALNVTQDGGVSFVNRTETLTNKTMSGSTNTFTDIPNSALVNNSITFGTQQVFLGDSISVLDSNTKYEIKGAVGGEANSAEIKLDVYDIDNNTLVTNPTPNGNTFVRVLGSGNITVSYSGDVITIGDTFVDTNTTYSVATNSGVQQVGTQFSLKNYTAFSDNNVLKWNAATGNFQDSSILDDGTTLTTSSDFQSEGTVKSFGDTTVGGNGVASNLILRSGSSITRQNSNITAVLTTDVSGNVQTSTNLFYDSVTTPTNNSSWKISDEDGNTGAIGYVRSDTAPTSSTAAGRPGEIIFSGGNLYACVAPDTWVFATVTTTF